MYVNLPILRVTLESGHGSVAALAVLPVDGITFGAVQAHSGDWRLLQAVRAGAGAYPNDGHVDGALQDLVHHLQLFGQCFPDV